MKNKLKQFWRVVVLAMVVLLAGCAKEEYQDEQVRINQRMVNLNDLPMLQQAIEAKRTKLRQTNKSLTDYLGMIVPDKIKLIEQDGTKYYTCALSMVEYEKLTNLVITEKDNVYDYKLIEYSSGNYDLWKADIEAGRHSNVTTEMNIKDLTTNKNLSMPCMVLLFSCPSGMHTGCYAGSGCKYDESDWISQLIIDIACINDMNSSSGDSSGSSGSESSGNQNTDSNGTNENENTGNSNGNTGNQYNNDGGTSSSTPPTPPVTPPPYTGPQIILTVPVLAEVEPSTPCEQLKKMSDNVANKASFNDLGTKTGLDEENGYACKMDNSFAGYIGTPVPIEKDITNPNILNVKPYLGQYYTSIFHTHPDPNSSDIAPMFGHGDIHTLWKLATKYNLPPGQSDMSAFTVTLTVKDNRLNNGNTTFAIKIKDFNAFDTFWSGNEATAYNDLYTNLERAYKNHSNGSAAPMKNFILDYLNAMKNLGLSDAIGLYEAEPNFTGWSEVVLDPSNPNEPLKQPCNP